MCKSTDAGFIAGYILTGIIFPQSGDPARAMAGVVMLLGSGFATYFIRKHLSQTNPELPYVARVFQIEG